jgi:hypothetical protein
MKPLLEQTSGSNSVFSSVATSAGGGYGGSATGGFNGQDGGSGGGEGGSNRAPGTGTATIKEMMVEHKTGATILMAQVVVVVQVQ